VLGGRQMGYYILGAVISNGCAVAAYVVAPGHTVMRSSLVGGLSVLLLHDIDFSIHRPGDVWVTMSPCISVSIAFSLNPLNSLPDRCLA